MPKFIRSLRFACSGIVLAVRSQRHMKIHSVAAGIVVIIGAMLPLSRLDWAVLLLAIALVITLEMVNTAVESTVDLASPGIHPLAKAAKDVAAGAVLVATCFAVIIGLLILGPPLWHFIRD
ncbi:diacylglycerol kinase family protein [Paenibacillus glycanilyticus]|uniref:Diacylglycerol kinase n=1 Tax=Paenibacillus glycanilyticus TaxID=126569 RepID=A0ABQ6GDY0_9BACL|nr:diacylglycerol kinase family protein [Paenibacillus glycanilyticus]GLX69159.1 diacylglycerol kinase [Paenibacillus glycanilyticus]